MTAQELKVTLWIGLIIALRMLGAFMVLPVLTDYVWINLQNNKEFFSGLAIGIYGVTQAIFHIPFGLMSDYFGRKRLIYIGLIIFIIGSFIASFSISIFGVIIGRALQGVGSISSVILALLSDFISEQNREKSIALIGASFFISFALATVFGPIIMNNIGLGGLFGVIGFFGFIGLLIVYFIIPNENFKIVIYDKNFIKNAIFQTFQNTELLKLNFVIFFLHFLLVINFFIFPSIISKLGIARNHYWIIYSIILLIAFIFIFLFFYFLNKNKINQILLFCIGIIIFSEMTFFVLSEKLWLMMLGMQLFFIAFSIIEALLPSLVIKKSCNEYKGIAIGLYLTSQFLGIGFGGIIGSLVL